MKCPESIEELQELERMIPLCRKTLYEQAKARIDTGAACSLHEASRQIADEAGKNPESVERAIQREQADRGVTVSPLSEKFKSNEHFRTSFTGDNEWYTPAKYIEAARKVLKGIDLDPATSEFAQKYIQAKKHYTVKDNGLNNAWDGKIWLNPPYSRDLLSLFIEKLVQEVLSERVKEAIVLTHNYTDTAWFHLLNTVSDLICFTKGRVRFVDDKGVEASPTQGSAFFYIGENQETFKEVFGEFGFIR